MGTTEEEIRAIRDSGLFDADYYLETYPDVRQAGVDPLHHFTHHGWKEGRNPSASFDTRLYAIHWLREDNIVRNPLYHYLVEGRKKGYSPNGPVASHIDGVSHPVSNLSDMSAIIRESGLFDAAYYLEAYPDVKEAGVDPLEHFLRSGWSEGRNPSRHFDTRFYQRMYLEDDVSEVNPLLHYIENGRKKGVHISEQQLLEALRKRMDSRWERMRIWIRDGVGFYRESLNRHQGLLPTLRRFSGNILADGPSGIPSNLRKSWDSFSAWRHNRQVLDTRSGNAGTDEEAGYPTSYRDALSPSATIVFIGCDGRLAGSQVLLLNILEWLHAHTSLELKTILVEGGELVDDYARFGPLIVWKEFTSRYPDPEERNTRLLEELGHIDLVYGNTFLAAAVYPALEGLGVPFISHIHELEQSFRAYAKPHDIESLHRLTSTYIACSRQVARNLVENHGADEGRMPIVNDFIRKQSTGRTQDRRRTLQRIGLPDDKFLVVGCGTVYWRKGPDLFVETAIRLKKMYGHRFRFLWIGEHCWDQDTESLRISTWKVIQDDIRQNGLEGHVLFIGPNPDALEQIRAADVFYLPSREDPFPLVCLEAAKGAVPVVCFEGTGGMPDVISDDAGIVVPLLDTAAAADAINRLRLDKDLRKRLGRTASEKLARCHTDDIALPRILDVCRTVMRKPPPVTVIVPVYNHAPFLRQRMDNILSQSFRDFEVIVLDDASTDDSFEIAKTYADDPRVRIIRNEVNSGSPFHQWRKGIELARGQFLWIAEGDDACTPDLLRELLPFFTDPDVAFAYCDSNVIDERDQPIGSYQSYYESLDFSHWKMDWVLPGEAEVNMGLGVKNTIPNASAVLFRKAHLLPAMLDDIADMRLSGDWLLYLHLARQHRIGYRSKPLNFHRKHTATITHRFNHVETHRQTLLEEAHRIHEFVFRHFNLSPSYRHKLADYLAEQIGSPDHGTGSVGQNPHYPVKQTLDILEGRIRDSRFTNRRMAFITTSDSVHDGGSEQLWIQTAVRLAQEGHPVLVIIRRWTPEPYFFDAFREAGITWAFKDDEPEQALAAFQPDLVVISTGDQDDGIPWYKACQEGNLAYVILNCLTKEPRYWPIRPERQEAVKTGNLQARQVFFTCRNNRSLMERRLGCAIPHASLFHSPLFIDRNLKIPFPSLDGPIRLAMPARLLTLHKGQHIAVQVFAMKKWRRRNIELHIYGKGPDEASLRETVEREKLHKVFFHTPQWQLPNPDVVSIWRDNHALLMCSFMEGMPLVLLNAMSHARVPIVTDIGGHREVVEDGVSGFIAEEPTVASVDEAMERAWKNLDDWKAIGLQARDHMLRFTPEDPVEDFIGKLLPFAGQ